MSSVFAGIALGAIAATVTIFVATVAYAARHYNSWEEPDD
jgi:hypothetical protein